MKGIREGHADSRYGIVTVGLTRYTLHTVNYPTWKYERLKTLALWKWSAAKKINGKRKSQGSSSSVDGQTSTCWKLQTMSSFTKSTRKSTDNRNCLKKLQTEHKFLADSVRHIVKLDMVWSLQQVEVWQSVTFYRGSIPALFLGLLSTAAVIISLTGRDLDGIRGRQTRLSGKPISHRRCRGPIVLKIAVKLRLDR